eukprot:gene5200-10403_t
MKIRNLFTPYTLTFILSTFSASLNLSHSTNSMIEIENLVKPIAIVFPQFHEIPENNKFWGKGFTEWTFLKPLTRIVNSILIRKPHRDIGFYNLLDYGHRAYMRIMADHFGIYGFCFYHFWFKDHPIMHKPVEAMIRDGEPNKPFFFCWANEQWTRRWDGGHDDVLMAQDYGDNNGNILHFKYLLTFFQHPNYIHINGKPMFAFYRIEKPNVVEIDNITKLWTTLALKNGLNGIHFVRFFGPFDNTVSNKDIKGFIEFEPISSWQRVGSGPIIFPDGKFNEKIYLENNPNIAARKLNGTLHYNRLSPDERRFRESQFKVYSTEKTWHVIERKNFKTYGKTYRGTAFYWNNAPRKNFTNGKYITYPHMLDQVDPDKFKAHLKRMSNIIQSEMMHNASDNFLFLAAWNEWNEQSVFEPNDIDGYDALMAVKSIAKRSTGKTIVHIAHRGGDTEKYIKVLIMLFDHYSHIYNPLTHIPNPNENCILLHIHSAMVGKGAPLWGIIDYAKRYKAMNISIYITIHDYQWLYPDNPNPTLSFLESHKPDIENIKNTILLISIAQIVIFPSRVIKDNFFKFLDDNNDKEENTTTTTTTFSHNHSNNSSNKKIVVTPHCDVLLSHSYTNIPAITSNVINIAFVSLFNHIKGSTIFLNLSEQLQVYQLMHSNNNISVKNNSYEIMYHVFGNIQQDLNCKYNECQDYVNKNLTKYKNIIFHKYKEYIDKNIFDLLSHNNIHILTYLSLFPETHSYALSLGINSGLSIVYLNRGSFIDRLNSNVKSTSPRYFSVANETELLEVVNASVAFVIANQNSTRGYQCQSRNVQPTKWYISNYPKR